MNQDKTDEEYNYPNRSHKGIEKLYHIMNYKLCICIYVYVD